MMYTVYHKATYMVHTFWYNVSQSHFGAGEIIPSDFCMENSRMILIQNKEIIVIIEYNWKFCFENDMNVVEASMG